MPDQRFKMSQFTDDTALGVESEEEINEVEKTTSHFEKESGARLNREKTCATGLGEWNKRASTGQSFKWVNQTAYLGVFVGKYYPGQKKRTIIEIRSEKNAVPRVISCSIRRNQRRAKVADSRGSDLPCADRA